MKVNIYSLYDKAAGCSVMVITAKNHDLAKRIVRTALMTKQPNPFNTDVKDKDLMLVGSIDQETNEVKACKPSLAFGIEDVRQELIEYISSETGKSQEEVSKHVGRNEEDIPDNKFEPIK